MEIVDQVRKASEIWGFFQMINHGIPVSVIARHVRSCAIIPEQTKEEKMEGVLAEVVIEYVKQMIELSKALSELLSEALG
ncbi:1-aminocyclopropane-1-carboxylate oxidase like protein 1 [Quercus suber]|uniref:1-aminocyclopropane-1-carboxylate oxidase like protein 1 n=1 Tax=Quercus suber TaxID=58331 RepID=A0AAW0LYL3_QUESU